MLGTVALKALIHFGLSAGELIEGLANGLGFDDIKKALEVVKEVKAVKGAKEAFQEYLDLDETEQDEIALWVATDFDLEDDKVESVVEFALGAAFHLAELVKLIAKPKAVA